MSLESQDAPRSADLLIVNGDILTMNPDRHVLEGGAIAVVDERIADVGATSVLRRRWHAAQVVDARGGIVTPGLVNGHQHVTNNTLTGCCVPDQWPLRKAIDEWSFPLASRMTGDDEELAATITAAQSALNGVTMLIEAGSVTWADRLAAGVRAVGIRSTLGIWGASLTGRPYCGPTDEVLAHHKALLDAYPPGDGLVSAWVTLIGHDTASDDLMAGAADLARSHGTGMTMHMSPVRSDPDHYLRRYNRRPMEHLADIGVLGRHLLIGHGVWVDDAEVDLLIQTGTALAYCPWAYLRLGQGASKMSRHAEIHLRGGRIALGCDSANSGDQTDVLRQACLAAGLAKDMRVDTTWFGAHEALEMATICGAEAIGMDHLIGSIEPGKMADIVIHDAEHANWTVPGDPVTQIVWGSDGRSVRDVFVAGRTIVRGGTCVTVDLAGLRQPARDGQAALLARAGLMKAHRWPHLPSA